MYQSTSYAGQKSKSVLTEISEQSARTARMVGQAQAGETDQRENPAQQIARWVAFQRDRVVRGLRRIVAPGRADAPT